MKWLATVLTLVSLLQASLKSDLYTDIAPFLGTIRSMNKLVSCIDPDGRMGLTLEPVYRALESLWKEEHGSALFRDPLQESPLRITGSFYFDSETRRLFLELFLFHGERYVAGSGAIDITRSGSEAIGHYAKLFNRGEAERGLVMRGLLADQIREMVVQGKVPPELYQQREFSVEADPSWQELIALELLQSQFGLHYSDHAPQELRIGVDGSIAIHPRRSERVQAQRSSSTVSTTGYLSKVGENFERIMPSLPLEYTILEDITHFVETEYPALFTDFSGTALRKLFPDQTRSTILTGAIHGGYSNPNVLYRWMTPASWISGLEQLVSIGREFDLALEVVDIVQDVHNDYRFWVVAKQEWTTTFKGEVRYKDSGYILCQMDFTPEGDRRNIALYYRLWFYDYATLSVAERKVRLTNDIAIQLNNVNGIDSSLKDVVREAIFLSL